MHLVVLAFFRLGLWAEMLGSRGRHGGNLGEVLEGVQAVQGTRISIKEAGPCDRRLGIGRNGKLRGGKRHGVGCVGKGCSFGGRQEEGVGAG